MKKKQQTAQHGNRPTNTILTNQRKKNPNLKKQKTQDMTNLLIAGTRTFEQYLVLQTTLHLYTKDVPNLKVITGCAKGTDSMAIRWAKEQGKPYQVYTADWNKWGKSAGPRRNQEMAKAADRAIVYWDGKSRGTANMIMNLKIQGVPYEVISTRH